MQQLVPWLALFDVIVYVGCAVYVCLALARYVFDAVTQRSVLPASTIRLGPPMAVLFILPRVIMRDYHAPESIASVLDAVSTLALLILVVLGVRMTFGMLSWIFSRLPRNSSS